MISVRKALAQPEQEPVAGDMTAERAAYFVRRFKHEEKLLGPNEQAALDFVISMLEAQPEQEPVAWLIDDDYTTVFRDIADVHRSKGADVLPLYTTPPQRKPPQFPTMLRKMWSGTEVQEWINENWSKA